MLDRFGRNITYLRLSVTEQCNLRCRYCMPADPACDVSCRGMADDMNGCSLKNGESCSAGECTGTGSIFLTQDEMITAVRAAASLGISKVRITGGEPLVRNDIIPISERTTAVEGIDEVCITTNGLLLDRYANELVRAGVTHINVSLDTLDADRYAYMTRSGRYCKTDTPSADSVTGNEKVGPEIVLKGIEAAITAGFEKIKINTVLIHGFNTDEIEALAELTVKYPVDVRFIELMPMIKGAFGPEAYISSDEVLNRLKTLEKAPDDGVARMYRLPGAKGGIGLISPVSAHFCAECNRLRLTADGRLKPCLHSKEEYSVKGLDEAGMRARMEEAILAKPEKHPRLAFDAMSDAGRSMNRIGG